MKEWYAGITSGLGKLLLDSHVSISPLRLCADLVIGFNLGFVLLDESKLQDVSVRTDCDAMRGNGP